MRLIKIVSTVFLLNSSFAIAVMAPWYWVGFPVQLNRNYAGNPEQLIGSQFTFIFDTYHYEKGKRYPAGRIMQSNNQVIHWYVALVPTRKAASFKDTASVVATMQPTPSVIQMLQLPKDTTAITIVALANTDDWSQLWMKDRQQMRAEFQEGDDGKKKPRKRWLTS